MKKVASLIVFIFFLFVILRTDFPSVPRLNQKIILCRSETILGWNTLKVHDQIAISCKDSIPVETLYKTKSLKVNFTANQSFSMNISLRYKSNELLSTGILVVKSEVIGSTNSLDFKFNKPGIPKINRLVSNMDEVVLLINNLDNSKELNLKINEISLD